MKALVMACSLSILFLVGCGDREERASSEPRVHVPAAAPPVEEILDSPVEGLSIIRVRPGVGDVVSGEGGEVLLDLQIYDDGERTWSGVFGFTIGKNQASDILELGATGAIAGEERRLELSPEVVERGGMQRDGEVPRVYQFRVEHVGSLEEFLKMPNASPGGTSNQ